MLADRTGVRFIFTKKEGQSAGEKGGRIVYFQMREDVMNQAFGIQQDILRAADAMKGSS